MTIYTNTFDGGTNGVGLTTGNTGGSSGNSFSFISSENTFSNERVHSGALSAKVPSGYADTSHGTITFGELAGVVSARYYMYAESVYSGVIGRFRTSKSITAMSINFASNKIGVTNPNTWRAANDFPLNTWVRIETLLELRSNPVPDRFRLAYYMGESSTPIEDSGWIDASTADNDSAGSIDRIDLFKISAPSLSAPWYIDSIQVNTNSDYTAEFIGAMFPEEEPPDGPNTGRIQSWVMTPVSSSSFTIGLGLVNFDDEVTVEISNELGTSPPVLIDSLVQWKHHTFTDLDPNLDYLISVYVNGVLQIDCADLRFRLDRFYGSDPEYRNFTAVAGSCQYTGSNHPVFEKMLENDPIFISHMGDLHYQDATSMGPWSLGVMSSLGSPGMKKLLEKTPMVWTWDNHDRIIMDKGGPGGGLNYGTTDPETLLHWKLLSGNAGWGTSDSAGKTWKTGRVRFIQTDNWTMKDDPDFDPEPRTFLGAAQKQWFKDTLIAAEEPLIVWFCQWPSAGASSGRWNSYNAETNELTSFLNSHPSIKERIVMIGADSHSLQVTDGTRTQGNFVGIPSLNISGFNRSSDSGHGGAGWLYDMALRDSTTSELEVGGYSRITVEDDGTDLEFLWEGVRVNNAGVEDVMASWSRVYSLSPDPDPDPIKNYYLGDNPVTLRLGDNPVILK